MKKKILKTSIVMLLILVLTIANFVPIGSSLVSYAAEEVSTNHKNVEFKAGFEDENGNLIEDIQKTIDSKDISLWLQVSVKKEGYFNGEISLNNTNFKLVATDSNYVNKVEGNTIYLNQINAGTTADIKIKVEPVQNEEYELGLLNSSTKISINGIYRDMTEKDIEIKANRTVNLKIVQDLNKDNMQNDIQVITNKVIKIDEEEKRVVQFLWTLGLKNNNYPEKEITGTVTLPVIDENVPEIKTITKLNNMTKQKIDINNNIITVKLENPETAEGKVMWKKSGQEQIIITAIYDKDKNIENKEISIEQNINFYDNANISGSETKTLSNEELDKIVDIRLINQENKIYKGKIYSGIDRTYSENIEVDINLKNAIQEVEIKEETPSFVNEENENKANIVINKTIVNKENMKNILGEDGTITIFDEKGNNIGVINKDSKADESGNIVISYNENQSSSIRFVTSKPQAEGTLKITNEKTIKNTNKEVIKNANMLQTKIVAGYNNQDTVGYLFKTELENSKTEASLELNKNTLSTIVGNELEMNIVLKSNNEKYDLYENPELVISMPEQVENITINSIDMLYEEDLKIADYRVDGKNIIIKLEGKQKQYKEQALEGANIIINATLELNKKSASSTENIVFTYNNQNSLEYIDSKEVGQTLSQIEIVAPKDVTAVHSVEELNIETLGQEEKTSVTLRKGEEEKNVTTKIEVINNNKEEIQNVRVLGDFPTNSDKNNMGITLTSGIILEDGISGTIYYSANENASEDLNNKENGWSNELNQNEAKKYLIIIEKIPAQSSIYASYDMKIPENLEYNQNASLGYSVIYGNTLTRTENKINATTIDLQTGIGPKIETKITSKVGQEDKETVKTGEVIKYKVEVSNTGTEDIQNVEVKAQIPEGTTLVVPEPNYEYTGAGYYEELQDRTFLGKIENLKVGSTESVEYEVRVNLDTTEGTKITQKAEVKYKEAIQETNEITKNVEEGNLRITVKKVTNRDTALYESGAVQYFAIIENISDETQENVTVKTNKSNILEVERLSLITGLEHNSVSDDELFSPAEISKAQNVDKQEEIETTEIETEEIEYKDEINIGTLNPNESKVLSYNMLINNVEDNQANISFSAIAKDSSKEYNSNVIEDTIKEFDISMEMTSNTESKYVKSGDSIIYTIKVKNNTNTYIERLKIEDSIPQALTVNKVTINNKDMGEINGNNLSLTCNVEANGETLITIETVVDYSAARVNAESITNIAYAKIFGETLANTSEITHIIEPDEEEQGSNEEVKDPEENQGGDIANGTNIITGIAWFDQNSNGRKDENESPLSGIRVQLLNVSTNNIVKDKDGKPLEAITNDNGVYILNNITKGQYIAIFDYDTSKYTLSKYKQDEVSEEENSDVLISKLTINNELKEVPATDIITISEENIDGINIGLTELKNFDLRLDKYITKMIVQNNRGTTQTEYDNETTAKVEIDAKDLNSSNVIIEYKIVVTNVGDTPGYARSIVDYVSKDLSFSSELNKDWYAQGDYLYSSSLANEEILPGQSKELKLTLTKKMTEDNTGLVPNTAEIAESYNEQGLQDSNSTPGNNVKGENDQGSADAIISIRTGAIVYTGIVIAVIAILGVAAFVIIKIKKSKGNN